MLQNKLHVLVARFTVALAQWVSATLVLGMFEPLSFFSSHLMDCYHYWTMRANPYRPPMQDM